MGKPLTKSKTGNDILRRALRTASLATIAGLGTATAYATDAPTPEASAPDATAPVADAAPPGFQIWGQLETGITANPDSPHSGVNYGHLFTDKANQPVLNQLLVTAEKPLDTNATDYALGYRLQAMFGTDARYTHFLGELDTDIKERTQLDIVEAWAFLHTPWLTEQGIDIKVGQFVTYLGAETIDPSGNAFYSKSYIFNFGLPLKHTGRWRSPTSTTRWTSMRASTPV